MIENFPQPKEPELPEVLLRILEHKDGYEIENHTDQLLIKYTGDVIPASILNDIFPKDTRSFTQEWDTGDEDTPGYWLLTITKVESPPV